MSTYFRRVARRFRMATPGLQHAWHRGAAWTVGPALVGLCAVLLALGGEQAAALQNAFYAAFPYAPLVCLPAGFALLAYLARRHAPGTLGSGIPQAIAALSDPQDAKSSRLLSLRLAVSKIFLTMGSIATGASLGREGPTVQIGASIMHAFYAHGHFLGAEARRLLIVTGAAAGIAAAFNTPLGGIMFAIEEMCRRHVFNANSSTLVTVIFSGLISLFLLGNYTYFGSTSGALPWPGGFATVLVCGAVGGLAGGIYSRAMIATMAALPGRLHGWRQRHPAAFAALCGLLLALLALATNNVVLGTGYEGVRASLEGQADLPWYYGVAKMGAILLSAISGIPGGIFAPSLAAGAGLGENLAMLPGLGPHGVVLVLTMAAYLSGVTREPLTSFVIMMELTNSHQLLLPLMAAAVVANGVSKLVCAPTLYATLADALEAQPARTKNPPA